MSAVEDLGEVASRALRAESMARSVTWQDRRAVARAAAQLTAVLDSERELLARPPLAGVGPSAAWEQRLGQLAEPVPQPPRSGDPTQVAAAAQADAAAAVSAARIALTQAQLAVLRARLETPDADADPGSATPSARGHRALPHTNPVARQARAVAAGLHAELVHIVRDRPRSLAKRLAQAAALGVAYLGFLRLFRWDVTEEHLPYLALYALSLVLGSAVCTNAMSVDAGRVGAALRAGTPLWQVIVAKNAAIVVLVGPVGLLLSVLLAWRTGDTNALIRACGLLFTLILLWLGVANVLSVVAPLRVVPLAQRRRDRTLRAFLVSLAVSYGITYVVTLMLYWRVWAQRTAIEELGGPWLPVGMTVASAALSWLLLTVLAVTLADRPRAHRALLRELVDHRRGTADPVRDVA